MFLTFFRDHSNNRNCT